MKQTENILTLASQIKYIMFSDLHNLFDSFKWSRACVHTRAFWIVHTIMTVFSAVLNDRSSVCKYHLFFSPRSLLLCWHCKITATAGKHRIFCCKCAALSISLASTAVAKRFYGPFTKVIKLENWSVLLAFALLICECQCDFYTIKPYDKSQDYC